MPRLILSLAVLSLTFLLTACGAPPEETAAAPEPATEPAPEPAAEETTAEDTAQAERPEAPMIEITNARQPMPGILSGGQPTDEQLQEAAEKGFRTVVNLRSEPEMEELAEAEQVQELGMHYVHIPMAGAEDLTEENVQALDAVLADDEAYPVLIHCASGNRVGGLLALRAHQVLGQDATEAFAFGVEAGLTRLAPAVRDALGLPPEDAAAEEGAPPSGT